MPYSGATPAHIGGEAIAFSSGAALNGTTDKTINVTAGAGLQDGDVLVLCVAIYSTDNAGSLNSVATADWPQFGGAGNNYGGAQTSRSGMAYHLVTSGETGGLSVTYNVTAVSGYTFGQIAHFRAAQGFASPPIQAIAATAATSSPLGMPTVVPPNTNCLAIAHVFGANAANTNPAIAEPTGESNGDWTTFDASGGTTGTFGWGSEIETSDQSSGATISGGTATYSGAGSAVAVGFAVVPVQIPKIILSTPSA